MHLIKWNKCESAVKNIVWTRTTVTRQSIPVICCSGYRRRHVYILSITATNAEECIVGAVIYSRVAVVPVQNFSLPVVIVSSVYGRRCLCLDILIYVPLSIPFKRGQLKCHVTFIAPRWVYPSVTYMDPIKRMSIQSMYTHTKCTSVHQIRAHIHRKVFLSYIGTKWIVCQLAKLPFQQNQQQWRRTGLLTRKVFLGQQRQGVP